PARGAPAAPARPARRARRAPARPPARRRAWSRRADGCGWPQGSPDHAARARCSAAAGLHPGALRTPPLNGNGSGRPLRPPTPGGLRTPRVEVIEGGSPVLRGRAMVAPEVLERERRTDYARGRRGVAQEDPEG